MEGFPVPELVQGGLPEIAKFVLEVLIEAAGRHVAIDVNHRRIPESSARGSLHGSIVD